jgi:hypothetical protein
VNSYLTQRGLILEALVARLKTIRTAAGYSYDVSDQAVVSDPVNPITWPVGMLPLLLVEISPSSRAFQPANRIRIETRFLITGRALAGGSEPDRKTKAGENLIGDIETAIGTDITLGGRVIDTRLQEPDGPMVGMGTNNNVFVLLEAVTTHIREYGRP